PDDLRQWPAEQIAGFTLEVTRVGQVGETNPQVAVEAQERTRRVVGHDLQLPLPFAHGRLGPTALLHLLGEAGVLAFEFFVLPREIGAVAFDLPANRDLFDRAPHRMPKPD